MPVLAGSLPGAGLGAQLDAVGAPEAGQVTPFGSCAGLGVVVGAAPRPPPSWPTITRDVGNELLAGVPPVANVSLLVRLIVRLVPAVLYGTVMMTGDQPAPAFGFNPAQEAPPVGALAPLPQL